jgi:hypothetical protein
LEERPRESHSDRRTLTGLALDFEAAATDLGPLAHHRHAEMPFRPGRGGVETNAVVTELQHDVVVLFVHADPNVRRLRVLQRVHDSFARNVVQQQRDRGRHLDLLDVTVEPDARIATHFIGERLERLGQALGAERRSVKVPDQCPDAIRGVLLRLPDLLKLSRELL